MTDHSDEYLPANTLHLYVKITGLESQLLEAADHIQRMSARVAHLESVVKDLQMRLDRVDE